MAACLVLAGSCGNSDERSTLDPLVQAIAACIGPTNPGDAPLTMSVADLGVAGVVGFESDRDGNPEIYALDIATGQTRRLTNDSAYDNAAEWSPDGTRIVFQSRRNGDWGVYSMAADGNDIRSLARDAGFPRWSPDGSRIVFVAGDGPDIYTMGSDGDNVVQLTSDPGFDSFPDWSPDGTRIIFQTDRNGADELLIMDADGGNLGSLPTPVLGGGPVWSPDGTRIAFHSSRDGNTDVYAANADGSEVSRLTFARGVDVFPDWSPDGSFLTFTSDRDGDFEIYVLSADGGRVAQLTDNKIEISALAGIRHRDDQARMPAARVSMTPSLDDTATARCLSKVPSPTCRRRAVGERLGTPGRS